MRTVSRWFHRRREDGQALVFLVLMIPIFLAVVGLVIDGGYMFLQYRRAYATANGAAQAAAQCVDKSHFAATNQVRLDQARAANAAREYVTLNGRGKLQLVSLAATQREVRVAVRARLDTMFMRIAGINQVTVSLQGIAYPAYGIRQQNE